MREARSQFDALDTRVVVVGTGAGYQAAHLMSTGFPFECLVDPDGVLYESLDIGRVGVLEWFRPSVIRRYVKAWRRGGRQGDITGDWRRLSGVAIIEPTRRIAYLFRAKSVGDYPPVAALIDTLSQ